MVSQATTPERLLELIAAVMPELRRMGVTRLGIFGSRARGDSRPDSDLDVLLTLEPGRDLVDLVAIRDRLQEIFSLRVDVVTPSGLAPRCRAAILRDALYATER